MRLSKWLLSAAIAGSMAGTAVAQTIDYGTTQPGQANNVAATALAKIVQEKHGIQIRIVPEAGMEMSGPRISDGRMDFTSANASDMGAAYTGTHHYEGKPPMTGLRVVAAIYSFPVAVIAPKDSDIKSVADLKGKRFPVGFSNQISAGLHAMGTLAAAGLTEDDVDGNPVANVGQNIDDMAQGKQDAAFFAVGAGRVKELESQLGGVCYLPIPTDDEAIARMREFVPNVSYMVLQPTPNDTAICGETPVMSDVFYLVAGQHVDGDVVKAFLDVLSTEKDALIAGSPAFRRFDPDQMYRVIEGVPMHPAAVEWFAEHNMSEQML